MLFQVGVQERVGTLVTVSISGGETKFPCGGLSYSRAKSSDPVLLPHHAIHPATVLRDGAGVVLGCRGSNKLLSGIFLGLVRVR